jgi:pilus assembly protein CpaD
MTTTMFRVAPKAAGAALALSLGFLLASCGGPKSNRSVESVRQPVVERTNFTLDVTTGPGGLAYTEQRRLAGWFEAMGLRYGDRVSIDDPLGSEVTRNAVAALASRYGISVSDTAPVTVGYVNAGVARVVVTRSKATVPGCPNWSTKSDFSFANATSSNYGCATNSNLAAMVANPEHLLQGAESDSDTVVMSSTKAIDAYRKSLPTGGGVTIKSTASTGN